MLGVEYEQRYWPSVVAQERFSELVRRKQEELTVEENPNRPISWTCGGQRPRPSNLRVLATGERRATFSNASKMSC